MDYDEFVHDRQRPLFRFAVVLCGDPVLAEELVQDVLVRCQWPDATGATSPAGAGTMLTMEASSSGTYRRSVGSPRGLARRELLLTAVVDDLAANGLADFSLRRAARAAGTTHKVLLYYFDGVEDLLAQAMRRLRAQRIDNVFTGTAGAKTLAERVAAFWPILMDDAAGLRVIDQAIGLAMYEPDRFGHLAREASDMYRGPLQSVCPPSWSEERRSEVAELILAAMRGFLLEWRTTGDGVRIAAALRALTRALEREESVDG